MFILVGCCSLLDLPSPMQDCEDDTECFNEAAEKCELANVTYAAGEGVDSAVFFEFYAESRGLEGSDCLYYLEMKESIYTPPQQPANEAEEVLVDSITEIYAGLKGKAMICQVPKEAIDEDGATGLLDGTDWDEYCAGTLLTGMANLDAQIEDAINEYLDTILADIPGSSFENPVVIEAETDTEGVSQEYEYLGTYACLNNDGIYELEMQELQEYNGHYFDVMYVLCNNGAQEVFYFQIDSFFGNWEES